MRFFDVFLLFILIVVLGVASYFLYLNLPGKLIILKPISNISNNPIIEGKIENQGKYSQSRQFYENMRFPDRKISYNIDGSCDEGRSSQAKQAFSILESKTLLSFNNVDDKLSAQIRVLCSNVAPEPEQQGHFIAGEGGPTKIINTSLYSVIFEGKLSLYEEEKCSTSHIALHEILHVLGFDHNNNPNNILYPTLNCNQVLDNYLVDRINELYKVPESADLKIFDIEATKSGRYLNFDIKVINQGLKDVENVVLQLYADNEFVGDFNLNRIDIGTTKTLEVENSKLPSRNIREITFVVDKENIIPELYEDNNEITLSV